MAMDKRRVQTAVIGHADSEIPVVLPMEAMEAGFFLARLDGHTFWCGVWLGGCGQQLTKKLYTDRACHFAHRPDPEHISTCARKAFGISSADHLFIKRGLLEWLSDQEVQAAADIVRGTDGSITGEVLFTLASHAGLHIHLDPKAQVRPGKDAQPLLGEGVPHDTNELQQHGYVNRVRLVPDGTRRRIQVGTQDHTSTTWFDLHEVALTDSGLTTPASQEIHRLRTTSRLIGARAPRVIQPRMLPEALTVKSHDPEPDNRDAVMASLIEAVDHGRSRTAIRHWLDRAEAATAGGATEEETGQIQRAVDALLLLERGVGLPTPREPNVAERKALRSVERVLANLARQNRRGIRAVTATQRNQLERAAEQVSEWLTDEQRAQIETWRSVPVQPVPPPRDPRPGIRTPPRSPQRPPVVRKADHVDIAGMSDEVRDILEHAARLGYTVPLSALRAQVKGLQHLSESDQIRVLLRVRPTARHPRSPVPERPILLPALITDDTGAMHPFYRRLAEAAGHEVPQDPNRTWKDATQAVHDRYKKT
ncbi:hypothetical protein [Streptomyces sp. NPDC057675]|uniref:hypothetical protein n=1 Tax=Streptomyces sp. NPDC057675 TaxID=3346204 RepID=UPI003699FC02